LEEVEEEEDESDGEAHEVKFARGEEHEQQEGESRKGGGGGTRRRRGGEEEEGAQGSLDAAVAFLTRHSRLLGFIS
jgi:hypothetical protein